MPSSEALPALCLVTDSSVRLCASIEEVVAEAVTGGVGMVQVRERGTPSGDLYRLAEKLRLVTRGKALLIINDRVDVALAVDAEGVHLPSHSLPVRVARQLGGGRLLVGRSVHGVEEAIAAERERADYLILGTIYGTASHPEGKVSGPELIEQVKARVQTPVYAIGGISASNISEVMRAGADGIAVIRAILESPDPQRAARELSDIVERHRLKARHVRPI